MENEQRSSSEEFLDSSAQEGSSRARELAERLQKDTSRTITPEPPPQPSQIVSVSDVLLRQATIVRDLQKQIIEESNVLKGMMFAIYPGQDIKIDLEEMIYALDQGTMVGSEPVRQLGDTPRGGPVEEERRRGL